MSIMELGGRDAKRESGAPSRYIKAIEMHGYDCNYIYHPSPVVVNAQSIMS